MLFQQFLSLLVLGDANELRVDEALAEVELLVTSPAEVLGADVAIVGLRALAIHSICGVTLRAAHALAECQCQPLALSLLRVQADTDNTILTATDEAMRHPFLLVNELQVSFSNTTDRLLVHVLDIFYF